MRCVPGASPSPGFCCENCGRVFTSPDDETPCPATLTMAEVAAGAGDPASLTPWQRLALLEQQGIPRALAAAEFESLTAGRDHKLIGSAIKAMFSKLGLPPCQGCDNRAAWLDKAHAFVNEFFGLT